ncbi:hypothetical protein [Carboxylicivirga taeanensis]|uniref:hypothetical protein n=1 Tax=Carboxylicivirga taeanensis TaxID=1416875 RepID=UPI003F6DE088
MKNSIIYVVVFAVLGLMIGYLFFGKIAGEYISVSTLIKPASNELLAFGQKLSGVDKIRSNIAICGGIGAVIGIIIRLLKK